MDFRNRFAFKNVNNYGKFFKKPFYPKFYNAPYAPLPFGSKRFFKKQFNQQRQANFHYQLAKHQHFQHHQQQQHHHNQQQHQQRFAKFHAPCYIGPPAYNNNNMMAPYHKNHHPKQGFGFYHKKFRFPDEFKKQKRFIYKSQRMTFKMQTRDTILKHKSRDSYSGQKDFKDFKWKHRVHRKFVGKRILIQPERKPSDFVPEPEEEPRENENIQKSKKPLSQLYFTATQPSISFQFVDTRENDSYMEMEHYQRERSCSSIRSGSSSMAAYVPYWESLPNTTETIEENAEFLSLSVSPISSAHSPYSPNSPTPPSSPTPPNSPTPSIKSPTPSIKSPTPSRKSPSPSIKSPTPLIKSPTPLMKSPTPLMKSQTPPLNSPTPPIIDEIDDELKLDTIP